MIIQLIKKFYPTLVVDSPEKGLFKIKGPKPGRVLSVRMYSSTSWAERKYLSEGRIGEWCIFEGGKSTYEDGIIEGSSTGEDLKWAVNSLLEKYEE